MGMRKDTNLENKVKTCAKPHGKSFVASTSIESEVQFMLECPLYNPIRDTFSSIFENVVLWSLKSFFQSNHQVGLCLYLMEATSLRHSRTLVDLKPS